MVGCGLAQPCHSDLSPPRTNMRLYASTCHYWLRSRERSLSHHGLSGPNSTCSLSHSRLFWGRVEKERRRLTGCGTWQPWDASVHARWALLLPHGRRFKSSATLSFSDCILIDYSSCTLHIRRLLTSEHTAAILSSQTPAHLQKHRFTTSTRWLPRKRSRPPSPIS